MVNKGEVIIYKTPDGETSIDVKLENETVWLNRHKLAVLFNRDIKTIGKHISNALREELANMPVVAKFATTALDGKTYRVEYYSLDMILSVGYRVKSKNGIYFRQWASRILKDYLINGYAVNHKIKNENYRELKELVRLVGRTMEAGKLQATDETQGLFNVVVDYSYALDTLDSYDYQNLTIEDTTVEEKFHATYEGAVEVIKNLKKKFGASKLFGNEKDKSFRSSIGQIYQTFEGKELYPSIEEKAAMLLYLVIKNHSFTDGNKRIAASLFLWFMNKNHILYGKDGSKRIADNTLVAMTLMIAESRPEEMNMIVKVVVNLINGKNE
jgi:prophage maintenance system killer protein